MLSKLTTMHDSVILEVLSCRVFQVQRICWDSKTLRMY